MRYKLEYDTNNETGKIEKSLESGKKKDEVHSEKEL